MKRGILFAWVAMLGVCGALFAGSLPTHAASTGEFSLQVTPSPLVTTVKPGVPQTTELKIRNAGSGTEELKIEPRAFNFNSTTGKVDLKDTTPPDIAQWVSFSNPTFTVRPGEWFTQKVKFSLPKESGFSYSFALIISRKNNPTPTSAGRLIKGSLAVFTLVNVDRPGAVRKLEVPKFVSSQGVYEYLPSDFSVTLKNTGNTIVQPYGNVFIQRGGKDAKPLATLPVNETHGYILPGSVRVLSTTWDSGFPVYQTVKTADGTEKQKLVWNWKNVSEFRFGRYTAKLVAVYNDGARDVPIEQEISFWVVPWKLILLAIAAVAAIWAVLHWRHKHKTSKAVDKAVKQALAAERAKNAEKPKETP